MANKIREGDYVILDVNGERFPMVKVVPGGQAKIGKNFVVLDPLIGASFGSTWGVTTEEDAQLVQREPEPVWDDITSTTKNNSQILANGNAQKLTQEEILQLQASGKDGREIINVLTSSSATFAQKTEFSQEKYIRKKAKKYVTKVIVRRPSARFLCDTYFNTDPRRINGLRIDTLSQMLHMGNVGANGRVLVIDYCAGLVTGAVLERMGGLGRVVMAHGDIHTPAHDIIHRFNFEEKHYDCVRSCSLKRLFEGPVPMNSTKRVEATEEEGAGPGPESEAAAVGEKRPRAAMEKKERPPMPPGKFSHRVKVLEDEELVKLREIGFTSVLVAWPAASYSTLMPALMRLLTPSAAFVCYHPSQLPLVQCFDKLFSDKNVINVQLTESWLREYQVLPMRTHPNMSMSGTGGFLLHGLRVDPVFKAPEPVAAAAKAEETPAAQ